MRREMVAVNGTVLTQVLSIAQMQAGTFFVDEDRTRRSMCGLRRERP